MHEQVLEILKHEFLLGFLNRIDETIVFQLPGREEIRQAVDLQLRKVEAQLAANGLQLKVADRARNLPADDGDAPAYGALPLKRVVQKRLQNQLANKLLARNFPSNCTVHVDGLGGELNSLPSVKARPFKLVGPAIESRGHRIPPARREVPWPPACSVRCRRHKTACFRTAFGYGRAVMAATLSAAADRAFAMTDSSDTGMPPRRLLSSAASMNA